MSIKTAHVILIAAILVGMIFVSSESGVHASASTMSYSFDSKFGSFGSGNNQFDFISEVAVDSNGNIYAADSSNQLVKKFDNDGNFLYSLCSPDPIYDFCDTPRAAALDTDDNVYIADTNHRRILKFDANGLFLGQFPVSAFAALGLDVDNFGDIYVASFSSFDYGVQKFDSSGNLLLQFCTPELNSGGSCGEATDIAVDNGGNIYVAGSIVQKYDSSGNPLYSLCTPNPAYDYCDSPRSIAVDGDGNVYVADSAYNGRVLIFDPEGNFVTLFDSISTELFTHGTGIEQFFGPTGIDVDSAGAVFISDVVNSRVLKFSPDMTADTEPPTITVPADFTLYATSSEGAVATFSVTAEDSIDGQVDVICNPSSDSLLPMGTNIVTCTAEDNSGNEASTTFKITVSPVFSGILQPVNNDGSSIFKRGSVVPIKFSLSDIDGHAISNLDTTLRVAKITNGVMGDESEAISPGAKADNGNLFRYDATSQQYIYNRSTKGLSDGTYAVKVYLNYGTPLQLILANDEPSDDVTVKLSLKK